MTINEVMEYLKIPNISEIDEIHYDNGKRVAGCYLFYHPTFNSIYVGSSGDVYKRICDHKYRLKKNIHGNWKLQKLYNQDENFLYRIFLTTNKEEALQYEQQILNTFMNSGILVNLNIYADKPPHLLSNTKEARDKISRSLKGKKRSEDTRQLIRLAKTGIKKEQHVKDKIRFTLKGRLLKPEHRLNVITALKGRIKPAHLCRKISIEGVTYRSIAEASNQIKTVSIYIIARRLKNPKYPTWKYET